MTTNRRIVRRTAVGVTLTAALGVTAGVLFASPAAADPYPGCIDPVDGVTVCVSYPKVGPSVAIAGVTTDASVNLTGALITLEKCVDGTCQVVATRTGAGESVSTAAVPAPYGSGTYTATASWSDDQGRQHHGVRAVGW